MIKKALFILLLLSSLLFTSCQKTKKKNLTTLRVNISTDPTTLDPRKGCDLNSATLHFLLYEGLVKQEPEKKHDLGIANKLEVSDDGLTYRFNLRRAYWSNGAPVTSYDFVQSFKDMLSPTFPAPNAHLLYCIKNAKKAKQGLISQRFIGVKAIDYKTLEIVLEKSTPYFLDILTFCNFSPVNQNIAQAESLYTHTNTRPLVCNGPYTIVKYNPGQEIILEKNPFYWDKDHVKLDRIYICIIDNARTTFNLFEKGLIDYVGIPFTQIPQETTTQEKYKKNIHTGDLPASTLLAFNLHSKIFKNKNMRKAFSLSVDRNEIYSSIQEEINDQKHISYFSKNLDKEPLDLFSMTPDIQNARRFLKKGLDELSLEISDLKHLTLMHSNYGKYSRLAQLLQEQWSKNLGILININTVEHKIFLDKLYTKNYELSLCCWIAQYLDKMNFFERFIHKDQNKNYPSYYNPDYLKLIDKLSETQNLQQIQKIYIQLEQLLATSYSVIPLYHWNNQYLLSNNIQSYQSLPGGSICYKKIITSNRESI